MKISLSIFLILIPISHVLHTSQTEFVNRFSSNSTSLDLDAKIETVNSCIALAQASLNYNLKMINSTFDEPTRQEAQELQDNIIILKQHIADQFALLDIHITALDNRIEVTIEEFLKIKLLRINSYDLPKFLNEELLKIEGSYREPNAFATNLSMLSDNEKQRLATINDIRKEVAFILLHLKDKRQILLAPKKKELLQAQKKIEIDYQKLLNAMLKRSKERIAQNVLERSVEDLALKEKNRVSTKPCSTFLKTASIKKVKKIASGGNRKTI